MKKLMTLLPLFLSIFACRIQSQSVPDVTNISNTTLTAIVQKDPQIGAPQRTVTPMTVQGQPTVMQPVRPESINSQLSLDVLRDAAYYSPDWGEFQLSDGIFYRTSPESPEVYTTRLMDTVLYGDINLDGIEDAVGFLTTQNGGTRHFVEMAAVLGLNGSARNISTLSLGNRVIIESGSIQISN